MTSVDINAESFNAAAGKVVLITGGASGIGRAAAEIFHAHGGKIFIGDLNEKLGIEAASVIGENFNFQVCDVTSWSSLLRLFEAVFDTYGKIDIVVANAGVPEIEDVFADVLDVSTGKLTEPKYRVIDIDLKSVFSTVKLGKHFFEKGKTKGSIVMTSSTAGVVGDTFIPVYTACKHGIIGLMRSLTGMGPFVDQNIRVNCVSPFLTETGFITPELRRAIKALPINQASSVAKAIVYLAITPSVTGRNIYIADNAFTELEEPTRKLRPQWLGKRAAELLEEPVKSDAMTAGHEKYRII